ncbi:MAG: glycine--tRNA ligase subunit beta [bacterium]|nr:glycine--tRNA ligase subunit beta [bacterium]
MKDFLLEIGTEEIPASWLEPASKRLSQLICDLLKTKGIAYGRVNRFYTPRRLAILVKDVAQKQKDKVIEITGPPKENAFDKSGKLTKAALGFAKAHGVDTCELKLKKKGKKEVIFCKKVEKGGLTSKILALALPELVKSIEFPKSMRWEATGMKFARPIRWIVTLFGKNVIKFELAGVKSGRKTQGLRFYPPISIKTASEYKQVLKSNSVFVDSSDRLERIKEGTDREANKLGLSYIGYRKLNPELLREVLNLVESPVAILCKFDEKYLELPKEVIIAALHSHQRYFTFSKEDGTLSTHFIVIANTEKGAIEEIRRGHEMVLKARLEDAEFYYREDMKIPIEKRIEELTGVVWMEGLGTLFEKTQRLISLSKYIAENYIIPEGISVDLNVLNKAAELSKVDLVTNMIKDGKEFTKLEGVYGSILAKEQGLDSEIVKTIQEYSVPFSTYPPAVALGNADRIDTIVGSFIIGKIPTGSFDPFGIRRRGNDLIYSIIGNKLHIPLRSLISKATATYKLSNPNIENDIFKFLIQRFKKYLEDRGVRGDIVEAVLGVPNEDVLDLKTRAEALDGLKSKGNFSALVILAKRVRNILKSSKSKVQDSKCKAELLKEPAERVLYNTLISQQDKFENYIGEKDYKSALDWLLNLAPLINNFFDEILVMAPEPELRENRLALLQYLHFYFFQKVADFSKIAE